MIRARRGWCLAGVLAALIACAHAPPGDARVHVVQRGETPAAIARRYAVPLDALLELNRIDDPTKLQVGQRLVLPGRDGDALPPAGLGASPAPSPSPTPSPSPVVVAPVEEEDTEAAADRAVARLLGGGGGADRDRVGAVEPPAPGAKPGSAAAAKPPVVAPPSPSPSARPTSPNAKPRSGEIPPIPGPPPPPDLAAMRATFTRSPRAGKARLVWPVEGVVVSLFGAREGQRHDGIDIGAPTGTAVWAAADGEVVFAGEQPGYGLLVLLAHADDVVTVYAHNAANLVVKGDRVKQGDPIAQVGQTGGTASPAVHFEVRVARVPQNPLAHLPDD